MPIGYLLAVMPVALATILALTPGRWSGPLRTVAYFCGLVLNETPFLAIAWLLGWTALAASQHALDAPSGPIALALSLLTTAGLALMTRRAFGTRSVVNEALRGQLGEAVGRVSLRQLPWGRILFAPLWFARSDVEHLRDIPYGDAGGEHLLDIYRPRTPRAGASASAPVLIHVHGGSFVRGRKDREARALLYRFAAAGWVCMSVNYRLGPASTFPRHVIDVKRASAWAREHGREYGADPATLFLAGGSAGGHLVALSTLTPNRPEFQPGFEEADTSVTAAVCLYGFYGTFGGRPELPSSPLAYVHGDAPPFLVVHGDADPLVSVDGARDFVELLRGVSSAPVVYAELPGAQHAFDFVHSIRSDTVVEAVSAFATWVVWNRDA